MSDSKSDYNRPFTNLYNLLPEVNQSSTNEALFHNLFNRYLTKTETERVAGYIGKGNFKNALQRRQIREFDVHRQAEQLQPILYDKIGSVESMASWMDLLNEAERLGIERERLPEWLDLLQFNWVPPIDIDKLINYRDYFWYDPENPTSTPEYITIRSRCQRAQTVVNFTQNLVDEYGSTISVVDVGRIDNGFPSHSVKQIDHTTQTIIVDGDASSIVQDEFLEIINTNQNDGIYNIAQAPVYDVYTNETTLTFSPGTFTTSESNKGDALFHRYDKLLVSGNYEQLFDPGFVFLFTNSSNNEIENTFVEVVDASFSTNTGQTTVQIDVVFTDSNIANGVVSLAEKLNAAIADRDCLCTGTVGWDIFNWDDNPEEPLWDGSHTSLINSITNNDAPSSPGNEGQLWYEQPADKLYQYGSQTGWKVLWNNFSKLLNDTTGQAFWDYTVGCGVSSRIPAADQWINQNKWFHKSDVPSFSIAKQAQLPILEYDWDLELNEWMYNDFQWKYRTEHFEIFESTNAKPSLIELMPLRLWELDTTGSNDKIILDERYGDLTGWFTPGTFFMGMNKADIIEVVYSRHEAAQEGEPYRTVIYVKQNIASSDLTPGDINNAQASASPLQPYRTSQGDPWAGYNVHWLLDTISNAMPAVHQPINPQLPIEQFQTPVYDGIDNVERRNSHFAQEVTVLSPTPPMSYDLRAPAFTITDITAAGTSGTIEISGDYTREFNSGSVVLVTGSTNNNGTYITESVNYNQGNNTTDVSIVNGQYLDVASPDGYILPLEAGTTRRLRQRALVGFDDVRVYINNIRQYGNYDELEDVVMSVSGISEVTPTTSPRKFNITVGDDVSGQLAVDDFVRYEHDTNVSAASYRVVDVNTNTITVEESPFVDISPAAANGQLYCITTPLENVEGTSYVRGIKFLSTVQLERYDSIRVEVGEASAKDVGFSVVPVRTIENNNAFSSSGTVSRSLINYRQAEQVKARRNQYPLFDIYHIDGTPANTVNHIFGFQTDPEQDVNALIGQRIVYEPTLNDYGFEQLLLDGDRMLAYRDYSNHDYQYWYDPQQQTVFVWTGLTWHDKVQMGRYYEQITVQKNKPEIPFDQQLWFNTITHKINRYDSSSNTWFELDVSITIRSDDPSLQTIWRKGLNDEKYQPVKRDWNMRTHEEYQQEQELFVQEEVDRLLAEQPTLTHSEAETQALNAWFDKQKEGAQQLSPSGQFVGDWEIPDPLYHNHMHENRRYVSSRELLTHFTSIIRNQPKIPGYIGRSSDMFRLIPTEQVNYGVGGSIKEFNHSFDTFLSALFVNNVTPVSLIEFAQQEYDKQLNAIQEYFRRDAVDLLTDTTTQALQNLSAYVTEHIIEQHEQNDRSAQVYGDTTSHTELSGGDTGVRNWIATLPLFNLVDTVYPVKNEDTSKGINEIVHHDGHRASYAFEQSVVDQLVQIVVNTPDQRTNGADTFGRISTNTPPDNSIEFDAAFNTSINQRQGVYWYQGTSLYRLAVISSGVTEPTSNFADGSLWFDTTTGSEVLRTKQTDPVTGVVDWPPVSGLTVGDGRLHNGSDPNDIQTASVSAWQIVDLNDVLSDVIVELEQRLFQNVGQFNDYAYNINQLEQQYPQKFEQLMKDRFHAYVTQQQIQQPYINDEFILSQPFTWNYYFSTIGTGFTIVDVDTDYNAFVVQGDVVSTFDSHTASTQPGQVSFYVKNTGANDGQWTTIMSTQTTPAAVYESQENVTIIYVTANVQQTTEGVIYRGTLPSSRNTGGESGADWRSLYNEIYHTPYPHLEPWKLQGYAEKPSWWDEEYLNDDTTKWGDRRWKYSHGFDIVGVDTGTQSFVINGDFRETFTQASAFEIKQAIGEHNGQWQVASLGPVANVTPGISGNASIEISGDVTNVIQAGVQFSVVDNSNQLTALLTATNAVYNNITTTIQVVESIDTATGFDYVSASTYVADTNTLTIRIDTSASSPPFNTAITSSAVVGRIALGVGMWENIRVGVIPAGRDYPNGVISETGNPNTDRTLHDLTVPEIPTYNYFSVNIDNQYVSSDGGTTKFYPDDVLPPYWDYSSHFGSAVPSTFDRTIRSLFFQFSIEIDSPSADYSFGNNSPVEWTWKTSSQYLYDRLIAAFILDPVRVFGNTFGIDFTYVGGLNVNSSTDRVFAHNRTNFHGDVVNQQLYQANGLNQWYVNYMRYNSVDANYSDFRSLWTEWTAPLMYQFSSFLDTQSLMVDHRDVCLSEYDYTVTAKRSPGVEDYWINSFDVSIVNIPPSVSRYDNQNDWRFELRTRSPIGQSISYYDVHNYQFYADPATDTCSIYTYPIQDANPFSSTFAVRGDQTSIIVADRQLDVSSSTNNDGTYTVISAVYNVIDDVTIIEVDSDFPSAIDDGLLKVNYRTLPWNTGDTVIFTTNETLPQPLRATGVQGPSSYFIIRVDDYTFKVASTYADALADNHIDLTTSGRDNSYIGQLASTFTALGGERVSIPWKHYQVDTSNVLTTTPPTHVQGVQTLINMLDGYQQYTEDQGWRINDDNSLTDPENPSRFVGWQTEIERFVDFIYGLQRRRNNIPTQYQAEVEVSTNAWTFTENTSSQLITGDPVNVYVDNGVYPTPLSRAARYYMIRDSLSEFRLAATKGDARAGTAIDITSDAGVGTLYVAPASELQLSRPTFEINPFRQGIWFAPERGIVSNTATGPTEDFRNTQLLFDQYGRPLNPENLVVFRYDQITSITIPEELPNDIELTRVFNDPYNYIHLGGAHIFVDTHEHVLKFNNYTTDGQLLYDPFVGLNVTKFELQYYRQTEFTQRPSVGGHFLSTDNNQGANLNENFEANVEGIRYMYDTYTVPETSEFTRQARNAIGFNTDSLDYFNDINLSDKSKFVFWRGMIQQKGSNNAINAFINSRRFIDAQVDEFWAFHVADFGSASEQEYISMNLTIQDAITNQLRLSFVNEGQSCDPGFDQNAYGNCGFSSSSDATTTQDYQTVSLNDEQRWDQQPNQIRALQDNGSNLYFTTSVSDAISVYTNGQPTTLQQGDAWIENVSGATYAFKRYQDSQINEHGRWDSSTATPLLRHNFASDDVTITLRWRPDGYKVTRTVPSAFDVSSTSPSGGGDGQITIVGDQTSWFEQGDVIEITQTSAQGRYTITNVPSLVSGNTVLTVSYVAGSGSGGINSNVSGTDILVHVDDIRSLTVDSYIPLTQSLAVFKDGVKLSSGDQFTETLQGNSLTSTTILFNSDVSGSTVDVVYESSTLQQGIHFEHVNSNIIRLLSNELVDPQIIDLKLYGIIVDEAAHNPARIIDTQSEVVISPIQIWDPARGFHYHNSIHVVDLINQQDPAVYTNTPNVNEQQSGAWNFEQVGTVWMDTSNLGYKPYYDTTIYSDISIRTNTWGQLADWADMTIYTWVESDVPPDQWDQLAEQEEVNTGIPQQQRKSGRVRRVLFEKDINGDWVPAQKRIDQYDAAIEGVVIGSGTYQFDLDSISIHNTVVNSIDTTEQQITLDQNFDEMIDEGMTIVIDENGVEVLYTVEQVTFEESTTVVNVDSTPTCSVGDTAMFIKRTDVYVNNTLRKQNAVLTPINGQSVQIPSLDVHDRVRLEQPLPSDQTVIDQRVQAGTLLQDVEHTVETRVDGFGQQQFRYYFWVSDKLTRGDKIQSPQSAEQNLEMIPQPFMFTQNIQESQVVTVNNVPQNIPKRYTGVIVRGLKGLIDDNQRYVIRFTRDYTLRDTLQDGETSISLDNLHREWELVRENQLVNIPRHLWDKITEAMVGYKLTQPSQRVPTLDRELYDQQFGTDTQYGLGDEQAFCDSQLALEVILADLQNDQNDFTPVDINTFFQNNSFDTNQDIVDSMDRIFNTFAFEHVNRIFFKVLHNAALVRKSKYPGILKTSMLSLHGIKPFQESGAFDD